MNENEQWQKWQPITGLGEKYWIIFVSDEYEGFQIKFADVKKQTKDVKVFFEGIASYQRTDETYQIKIVHDLSAKYGDNFIGWTFFKVLNSGYLKYLSEQSFGISDDRNLMHFCFIAGDDIMHVISAWEPKVEFIE